MAEPFQVQDAVSGAGSEVFAEEQEHDGDAVAGLLVDAFSLSPDLVFPLDFAFAVDAAQLGPLPDESSVGLEFTDKLAVGADATLAVNLSDLGSVTANGTVFLDFSDGRGLEAKSAIVLDAGPFGTSHSDGGVGPDASG